jgi:hypothetical protein
MAQGTWGKFKINGVIMRLDRRIQYPTTENQKRLDSAVKPQNDRKVPLLWNR